MSGPRTTAYRRDPLWRLAMVHRVSGLLLAVFLPLHFLTLGLALDGETRLDGFLRWADQPLVKLGEAALLALLVVHLLGGLRILAVELLPWRGGLKRLAVAGFLAGLVAAALFLANSFIRG